jgi:4-amino-4-deoxy-L-arabinose transferase-like glycosyltransferase
MGRQRGHLVRAPSRPSHHLSRLRSFPAALGAIAVAGLALRIAYVRAYSSHIRFGLDALWYELVAGTLATGHGYIDPAQFYQQGVSQPTAFRPPLYPVALAAVTKAVDGSPRTYQYAGCVLGALTIVLVALLARHLAGRPVALVAAGLAALSPALLAVDASIMSETLYVPLVIVFIWAIYAAIERPTLSRWLLAGVAAGACVLTRADALALTVVVIVPSAYLLRSRVPHWSPPSPSCLRG